MDDFYIYLVVTGGGTRVIPNWLEKGGASKWFLGAEVPYHTEITNRLVWNNHDFKACSSDMAELLAQYALLDTCARMEKPTVGIGATSVLTVDNEREGRENKLWISLAHITVNEEYEEEVNFITKRFGFKPGTREQQEIECAAAIDLFTKETLDAIKHNKT